MLHWAVTFLIIGLVAALLGVTGVAGTTTYIAYVLFVIFVIVAIVSLVMDNGLLHNKGRVTPRFFAGATVLAEGAEEVDSHRPSRSS